MAARGESSKMRVASVGPTFTCQWLSTTARMRLVSPSKEVSFEVRHGWPTIDDTENGRTEQNSVAQYNRTLARTPTAPPRSMGTWGTPSIEPSSGLIQ